MTALWGKLSSALLATAGREKSPTYHREGVKKGFLAVIIFSGTNILLENIYFL